MPVNFIPDIKSPDEVYDVGCLCEVKIKEQREFGVIYVIIIQQNVLIKPLSICKITEFTINPTPFGEVKAMVFQEESLTEHNVDMETAVKFQYLRSLLSRVTENSKDDNFKRLIIALSQNYNIDVINDLINLCISSLAMPKIFHKYGFLLTQIKSERIQELIEIINVKDKLQQTTNIFSEFCNKIEMWEKLEDEYDVSKERAKATEKLQSIYESLKNIFETDKDEKKIQIERFKKNLEGKTVPDHIMKVNWINQVR